MRETEQIATNVIQDALAVFQRQTGLQANVVDYEPVMRQAKYRPDARILIAVDGKEHEFLIEAKTIVDREEIAGHIRAHWPEDHDPPVVLVARYITPAAAQRCRELRLFFIDAAGNIYLRVPGIHIQILGNKPADLPRRETGKLNTKAGLKIVFALLCRPDLLNATYRDIADGANVALGTVGPVVKELEGRNFVATFGTTLVRRRFLDPRKLVLDWTANYMTTLRPTLNAKRFKAPVGGWEHITKTLRDGFWGGQVAAERLGAMQGPEHGIFYIKRGGNKAIAEMRLQPDLNGNLELLDVFWNPNKIPHEDDCVPVLLVYADLMNTTDTRNHEVANELYEEHIAPTINRAR